MYIIILSYTFPIKSNEILRLTILHRVRVTFRSEFRSLSFINGTYNGFIYKLTYILNSDHFLF